VALNALAYQPTNENCGTYTNWAEERDLRTGFTSTSRTPFIFTIIPGAPSNPVSETNCAGNGQYGMCANPPLLVTVVTNAANPPGTITVNWFDANTNLVQSGGPIAGSDIVPFTPADSSPGIYTYYAQASNPASGFVSADWTALTFEVRPVPQWTNGPEFYTNLLTGPYQTNPTMVVIPAITNLFDVTNFSPTASIVVDWYTSADPTVATFGNTNAVAYGGALSSAASWGLPGGVVPGTGTAGGFIPTNQICGTYTYYARARVVDPTYASACTCQSPYLVPVTFVLLPPPPMDASVGLTNVLTVPFQTNMPIWVDLVTNFDNPASSFVVNWYSTPQGSNAFVNLDNVTDTNSNNRFFHTPVNAVCGVFTNWAETMALNTATGSPIVSQSRIPVVFAIVPANPTAVGTTDVTNCIQIPTPTFSVIVTNGQTADWYMWSGTSIVGSPVAVGTSFTPTNSSAGTFEFAAEAVDPSSGLSSTGAVLATLSLYDCSQPLAISLNSTNGTGTIQWPGNLTLLSTTNLTPPVVWTSVSTGSVFSTLNTLTFINTNPPVQFFRLTN
jgi:hypothetical protein